MNMNRVEPDSPHSLDMDQKENSRKRSKQNRPVKPAVQRFQAAWVCEEARWVVLG